jgi:hypothetical protein
VIASMLMPLHIDCGPTVMVQYVIIIMVQYVWEQPRSQGCRVFALCFTQYFDFMKP